MKYRLCFPESNIFVNTFFFFAKISIFFISVINSGVDA